MWAKVAKVGLKTVFLIYRNSVFLAFTSLPQTNAIQVLFGLVKAGVLTLLLTYDGRTCPQAVFCSGFRVPCQFANATESLNVLPAIDVEACPGFCNGRALKKRTQVFCLPLRQGSVPSISPHYPFPILELVSLCFQLSLSILFHSH